MAQDQSATFLNQLDSVGFTSFTALVRQVQAAGQLGSSWTDALSGSSTQYTLFVPNNDACE